jgi:hypothetical protein
MAVELKDSLLEGTENPPSCRAFSSCTRPEGVDPGTKCRDDVF